MNFTREEYSLRLEKVKKGIVFASNYTQEHYAERLLKEIKQFLIK